MEDVDFISVLINVSLHVHMRAAWALDLATGQEAGAKASQG
jgi:hypothetical protein